MFFVSRRLSFLFASLCLLAYAWAMGAVIHGARVELPSLGLKAEAHLLVLGKRAPSGVVDSDFLGRISRLDILLDACPSCIAIASGATSGGAMSEAALVSEALPHRSILLEEQARTTRENFRHSRELLEGSEDLVIITSRYHQARAGLLASQEGLEAVLMPAEDTWEWSGDNLRAAMREAALYWPARWGW